MHQAECPKCGSTWIPRKAHIKKCPKCKNIIKLQIKTQYETCPHCRYTWVARNRNVKQCPKCERFLYRNTLAYEKELVSEEDINHTIESFVNRKDIEGELSMGGACEKSLKILANSLVFLSQKLLGVPDSLRINTGADVRNIVSAICDLYRLISEAPSKATEGELTLGEGVFAWWELSDEDQIRYSQLTAKLESLIQKSKKKGGESSSNDPLAKLVS